MKQVNRIIAVVFFALAVFIFWSATTFGQTLIRDNYLGAAFYPKILAAGMAVFAIILLVSKAKTADENGNLREKINQVFGREIKRPLSAFSLLVVYAVLLPLIGFVLGTTALFVALLLLFRVKTLWYYAFGTVFVIILFFIFERLFLVGLPAPFWS